MEDDRETQPPNLIGTIAFTIFLSLVVGIVVYVGIGAIALIVAAITGHFPHLHF